MARSDRATFRLPAVALFVPVLLFVCATPLATAGGLWWVLYIVPVLGFVWVLITHTRATAQKITTLGLLGSKTMTWDELDQLELPDARWAIAVGQDGRRLRLPMVRPRDVPRLVAVSGGSLRLGATADPPADAEQAVAPDERPLTPDQVPADGSGNPVPGTAALVRNDVHASDIPAEVPATAVSGADSPVADASIAGEGVAKLPR